MSEFSLVASWHSAGVLFSSRLRFRCSKERLSQSSGTASVQDTSTGWTGWETLPTPTLLVWTWFRRKERCRLWSGLSMRTPERWELLQERTYVCVCVYISSLTHLKSPVCFSQVSLVATAPLTNLALAVRMDPSLPSKLRGLFIMGGNTECQ